jgi:mannan endo-1,4-beta-mannosidase
MTISDKGNYCLTGAFISDMPSAKDIISFSDNYSKKPFFIMIFNDWKGFPDEDILRGIIAQGSAPVITWEPWHWDDEKAVSVEDILNRDFDEYIDAFAHALGRLESTVYMRFAHEMNGDWYPWSSAFIGHDMYKAMYRYVKDRFDILKIDNVKWIFSINWENMPKDNYYTDSYPGVDYVDYIGIDGYNWGSSQPWSRWMSFNDIFRPVYKEVSGYFDKDIIITEFSSTSSGGDKSEWITEALQDIKTMNRIMGFILFNIDKETDWSFPAHAPYGKAFRQGIQDAYFLEKPHPKDLDQ